jgi:hypothetical protein
LLSKRIVIGLAAVLAVAAFAAVPGAAQAACVSTNTTCPHYYVNGAQVKGGTAFTKTAIGWGTLTLKGTKGNILGGHITCHNAGAGTLFNPEPLATSAGEGLIQQFAPFACEQELVCPTGTNGVAVKAENLPWHDLLTEEVAGITRQETTGVKVNIICSEGGIVKAELKFVIGATEKGQRPKTVEGTSALHPGLLEFDAGSGELELEGSLGATQGKTEGAGKELGYNAQELLAVKNP